MFIGFDAGAYRKRAHFAFPFSSPHAHIQQSRNTADSRVSFVSHLSMQSTLIHWRRSCGSCSVCFCAVLYSSRLIYLRRLFMCWRCAVCRSSSIHTPPTSVLPFKSGLILSARRMSKVEEKILSAFIEIHTHFYLRLRCCRWAYGREHGVSMGYDLCADDCAHIPRASAATGTQKKRKEKLCAFG